MRRGFGVSLGTMGNGLGQEKGKQPGFTWILALRHLCGQPLSRKPTVREWPLLPPPPPSCLFLIMLSGSDILQVPSRQIPGPLDSLSP